MQKHFYRSRLYLSLLLLLTALSACSPQYNWRETHGNSVPFTVLMPAKADAFTQTIDLNGTQVAMTMTAADVADVTFAVGTATFADAAAAQDALVQMKTALINNIGGSPLDLVPPGKEIAGVHSITFAASGVDRGKPLKMIGRLYNMDKRAYQVIMVGNPKKMPDEAIETFFTSFQPN
ncbi:hypothetical protein D9O50_06450 [Oxalobacteraceae bacterium CAVE-383]|nr:hypothetical protein D9O50_06450 [Oxalobacteraceae bacterium CAVE-383]